MEDGFCPDCAYEMCQRCSVCPMCGHGLEGVDTVALGDLVAQLREKIAALELSASTGCESPPDDCECPGCSLAAETNRIKALQSTGRED